MQPFSCQLQLCEEVLALLTEQENQLDKVEAARPAAQDLVDEFLQGHLDEGYALTLSNFLGVPPAKLDELSLFLSLLDDYLVKQKNQAEGSLLSLLRLRRPA